MIQPDFFLVTSVDHEWAETVSLAHEAWKLADQPDALAIYLCCPADGTMRDVTTDEAWAWFHANWHPGDGLLALFEPIVEGTAREMEVRGA